MTLLDDIYGVHDGVLKAPPLTYSGVSVGINALRLVNEIRNTAEDNEVIYSHAKILAIEAVRIMQLASKNIEKERQEAENRKAKTARTLYDIINHDERESCTTCADSKRCKRHESITWCINWNELIQKDEPDYVFEVGILLGTVRKQ